MTTHRTSRAPWSALAALAAACLACGSLTVDPTPTPTPDTLEEARPTLTSIPSALPTFTPTAGALNPPTTIPSPTPPLTPTPPYPWSAGHVRVFPGPEHYIGDRLTVELEGYNLERLADDEAMPLMLGDEVLSASPSVAYSPLRANALVYRWVWDTSGQSEGQYRLTIALPPTPLGQEQTVDFYINLLPGDERPAQEIDATWIQRNTPGCCLLNTITHTAAERDLDQLVAAAEDAATHIEGILGSRIAGRPVPITVIDNVWGNGGYLNRDIVVSYVDRAYTGPDFETLLRHELAHWAMRSYGENGPPALLSEGMAVYLAGGHFKQENIPARAAALVAIGGDLPLADLADTFWTVQHEAAYLESAGFVSYLIERNGVSRFLQLYSADPDESTPSVWLDSALRRVYGLTLQDAERDYRAWLADQQPTHADQEDVRLTMALMDTSRRYQTLYYQYQESLPTAQEAIEAGQTAEFLREPRSVYNITLETMLLSAHRALMAGDTMRADAIISAVSATLDDADFSRELVSDYRALAQAAHNAGMEAQSITINGDTASIVATVDPPNLRTLTATFRSDGWRLAD